MPEALRLSGSRHPAPHLTVLTPSMWNALHIPSASYSEQINRLWKLFDAVDTDWSDDIDATELRKYQFIRLLAIMPLMLSQGTALINGDWTRAYLRVSILPDGVGR